MVLRKRTIQASNKHEGMITNDNAKHTDALKRSCDVQIRNLPLTLSWNPPLETSTKSLLRLEPSTKNSAWLLGDKSTGAVSIASSGTAADADVEPESAIVRTTDQD